MKTQMLVGVVAFLSATVNLWAVANDDARKAELETLSSRLKYQTGQIHLRDGLATVNLTDEFRYVDPAGTETLLTGVWGNPPAKTRPLGMIVPANFDPFAPDSWCVVLDYQEDGYVKDNDAESINYDKLLKTMQEATHKANTERMKNGYPAVELVGWATAPHYDKDTHKFYWAKEIKFGNDKHGNTLNYNLRILGRRGVLVLNAVANMSEIQQIEEATPKILGMVDFDAGNRYADYTPGVDKIATYGLAALVAGGIAAKAGLFKALFVAILALKKFVLLGVAAIVGFFKKLFGGKKQGGSAS